MLAAVACLLPLEILAELNLFIERRIVALEKVKGALAEVAKGIAKKLQKA